MFKQRAASQPAAHLRPLLNFKEGRQQLNCQQYAQLLTAAAAAAAIGITVAIAAAAPAALPAATGGGAVPGAVAIAGAIAGTLLHASFQVQA